jgi:hypothetical protein
MHNQNFRANTGFTPDDRIETRSDLKCGDLVRFERIDTHRVQMEVMMIEEMLGFPGRVYQIERSSTAERIILSQLDACLIFDP